MNFLAIYIVIIFHLYRLASSELYTALVTMEPLLETHRRIIRNMEKYLNTETTRLNTLAKYLALYQKEHDIATKDISLYLGNPINCYTLIKRLTQDLNLLEKEIINNRTVYKKSRKVTYPTTEDLQGAIVAVSRVQDTYQLNITQIANGMSAGSTSMTASDCLKLGKGLYDEKDYKNGLKWMKMALLTYKENDTEIYGFTKADIMESICLGHYNSDDIENYLIWAKKILDLKLKYSPQTARHMHLINHYQNHANTRKTNHQKIEEPNKKMQELKKYKAQCRGEITVLRKVANRLRCRYLKETHPFLRLAPLKLEELYLEPDIVMLHNVISNADIEHLKNISRSKLSRSLVKDRKKKKYITPAHFRIAKVAWHSHKCSRVIKRIMKRVTHFTGLSIDRAEDLQIVNYGVGGHYDPHFDFIYDKSDVKVLKDGDRIATILFYLTEVAQGGATVFLHLGLTIYPVKGAALFWMNLHRSGEVDFATRHAACPMIKGSKWVSTIWLHQHGQEFLRPCDLNQQLSHNRILQYPITTNYYS